MTWGLEDEFPLKSGDFEGPTVNLPEGKPSINYNGLSHYFFRVYLTYSPPKGWLNPYK